ncbi:hypothetical protein ACSFBF_24505 [Variovorax sp. ZT5P49]|uniref:hypothetical protein n=1 Tax=Variovorax sp. ZT5P49 TaxID=3443733 RepID=UPI003F460735
MNLARLVFLAASAASLVGCGNLQGLQVASVPTALSGKPIQVSTTPPAKEAIAPRGYALEKQGLYVLQTGGGSAITGIIFGPLGMLANSASIGAQTRQLGDTASKSSLLQLNPLDELSTAWKALPEPVPTSASAVDGHLKLSPYLLLYVDDDRKNLFTVVGIRAEAEPAKGVKAWNGNYNFALERVLPVDRLATASTGAEFDAYRLEIQEAYRQLRTELLTDLGPANPASHSKVATVKAPILRSTLMGFAGFTFGDVDIAPGGRMVVRVNMDNYGPAMDKSVPYALWIFPSAKQYEFDLGPEPRKTRQ